MTTQTASDADRGLADFWAVYDRHYDEIRHELMESSDPQIAGLLARVPEDERERRAAASRALLQQAVEQGRWDAYQAHLADQGRAYADLGLSFESWFSLTTAFRSRVLPLLLAEYGAEHDRLLGAVEAMGAFVDRALSVIGEAYLQEKQDTIARQHEAIDELSTPVLQLHEGLLLQPVIGVVDSARARQLTETMLEAIRRHRARVVVIDITGVAEVDSEVANRLLQAARAAGLMGATAIVTGLSAGVAQAMVTLGVDLGRLRTLASLEAGIDEANGILGYRVVKQAPESVPGGQL